MKPHRGRCFNSAVHVSVSPETIIIAGSAVGFAIVAWH
jgi:hypothetical protein